MAIVPGGEPSGTYTVVVDDNFHYQDTEYRTVIPGFPTAEDALEKCRSIVEACLEECAEPGRGAEEIFAYYQAFGEDPWIRGADVKFSAWDYAEANAHRFVRRQSDGRCQGGHNCAQECATAM